MAAGLRDASRGLWRFAVGLGILVLHGHEAIDHGAGAASTAEVLHAVGVCLLELPAGELNERLIVAGLVAMEAVDPGQPPVAIHAFFIAAHVAGIALAVSHGSHLLLEKVPQARGGWPVEKWEETKDLRKVWD